MNDEIELGANVGWVSGEQATRFGLGAIYKVDRDMCFRAKVSNASQLAVAMTHSLTFRMSACFVKRFNPALLQRTLSPVKSPKCFFDAK